MGIAIDRAEDAVWKRRFRAWKIGAVAPSKLDPSKGIVGRAVCVSAGSDDPLVLGAGQTSSANSCPASFLPTASRSFLSRLTFHFSLGNAF